MVKPAGLVMNGVGSTGAPLPPEGFRWVYESVGGDLLLSSISGGTDVCTAFVGGCPLLPVRVERQRPAQLRVTLHRPVLPDHGLAPEAQARQMMAQVNALFESWIVERPHEWQCFQNRWPRATRRRVLQMRASGAVAP